MWPDGLDPETFQANLGLAATSAFPDLRIEGLQHAEDWRPRPQAFLCDPNARNLDGSRDQDVSLASHATICCLP